MLLTATPVSNSPLEIYAMLSLGLAVIFGLLNIINFTHGAQFMMGAFVAWMLLNYIGIGYWGALILAPIIVGLTARVRAAAIWALGSQYASFAIQFITSVVLARWYITPAQLGLRTKEVTISDDEGIRPGTTTGLAVRLARPQFRAMIVPGRTVSRTK